MQNYIYKESKVITKKIAGFYDATRHIIDVDGVAKDIVEELNDFEGAPIEIVIKLKEESDLSAGD